MSKTHNLFTIPANVISSCLAVLREHKFTDVDVYDKTTTRFTVTDKNIIDCIQPLCDCSNQTVNLNLATIHYIKYELNGNYEVTPHTDVCDNTIIIYMDKDPNIRENFYVENNMISGDSLWKFRGLHMKNESKHWGHYSGKGVREVLCIFYG